MSETALEKSGRLEPQALLIDVQGRDYLPVAARIALFRERYPADAGWAIIADLVAGGTDQSFALSVARVIDPDGRVVATGTKSAVKGRFPHCEKAETGAIGRALGVLGIGTLWASEFEEDEFGEEEPHLADAPVERKKPGSGDEKAAPVARKTKSEETTCIICGESVTPERANLCRTRKKPMSHRACEERAGEEM